MKANKIKGHIESLFDKNKLDFEGEYFIDDTREITRIGDSTNLRPEVVNNAMNSNIDSTQVTNIVFFGTSLTEHLEAYIPEIYDQLNLPKIDSGLVVNDWPKRGFVAMLENRLITSKPYLNIAVHNFGKGGANSFEIMKVIQKIYPMVNPLI